MFILAAALFRDLQYWHWKSLARFRNLKKRKNIIFLIFEMPYFWNNQPFFIIFNLRFSVFSFSLQISVLGRKVLILNAKTGEKEVGLIQSKMSKRNTKCEEYKESPNVFSKERLGLADSAGGQDSSPNTTFSSLEEETFTCLNFFQAEKPKRRFLTKVWLKKKQPI